MSTDIPSTLNGTQESSSSRSATPLPADDGTISVRSMTSASKGDFRRTSFILTAVQNALSNFSVSSKQIFQGGTVI